jgi:hypothetical protein
MKVHKFIFLLFSFGLLFYSITYFLIQKRFDKTSFGGAAIYVVGIIISYAAYQMARNKKKRQDVIDSLP